MEVAAPSPELLLIVEDHSAHYIPTIRPPSPATRIRQVHDTALELILRLDVASDLAIVPLELSTERKKANSLNYGLHFNVIKSKAN